MSDPYFLIIKFGFVFINKYEPDIGLVFVPSILTVLRVQWFLNFTSFVWVPIIMKNIVYYIFFLFIYQETLV